MNKILVFSALFVGLFSIHNALAQINEGVTISSQI